MAKMKIMNRVSVTAFGVLSLSVGSSAIAQDAVQWRVDDGGNGHWYDAIPIQISWNNARSAALALGGDLASLEEDGELSALITLLLDPNRQLLFAPQGWGPHVGGLKDPDSGEFMWLTGGPIDCSNLTCENGNPSQTRVQLSTYNDDLGYGYNDVYEDAAPDASHPGYLIEYSADCNGDGIVDYGQILDGTLADDDGNGVPDCCDAGEPCYLQLINVAQWPTEDGGNGHWYGLVDIGGQPPVSAEEHFLIAESLGGHTATMASAAENEFSFNRHPGVSAFIGVRKVEGTNQGAWITGEPWSYTNWHAGEGGNSWERYAVYWAQGGTPVSQWLDTDLSGGRHSIIEWSADCNGDGIVDYGQILDGTFADANANGIPDCCEIDSVHRCVCNGASRRWVAMDIGTARFATSPASVGQAFENDPNRWAVTW